MARPDWNVAKRYQGQTDIPINETGRRQAARNGRRLAELIGKAPAFDFVASPLSRTTETMEIIRREMGLEVAGYRKDDRLKEINFGHWEARVWYDLPQEDPEGFAARRADPWGWTPRGGESYAMLSERVAAWARELASPSVVVSHGGVSRVLRGLALGLDGRSVPTLEVPQDRVMIIRDGKVEWA